MTGLHILVPPKSPDSPPQTFPLTNSTSGKTLTIGEITTDDAVLEFLPEQPAQDRFTLRIDHLTLDHVGQSDPVTFHARFSNTEPPGEIRSDGQFGPWNDDGSRPARNFRVRTPMNTQSSACSKALPALYPRKENSAALWATSMPKGTLTCPISRSPAAPTRST